MKSSKEMAHDIFQRINEYKTEKKRKRIKMTKITALLFSGCMALSVGVLISKSRVVVPPIEQFTSNVNHSTYSDVTNNEQHNTEEVIAISTDITSESVNKATTATSVSGIKESRTHATDITPHASENDTNEPDTEQTTEATVLPDEIIQEPQEDQPSQTTTVINPTLPSTAKTTEVQISHDDPGSPNGVYTELYVDYNTAKEIFAHPIVSYTSNDFINYKIGVISQNGNINSGGALCLSVTYEFTNGSISMSDQDRLSGSISIAAMDQYEYCGRIFYIQAPNDYEDRIRIGYYPSQDSGIAYQAVFDNGSDIYEIMDMIISIEI